MLGFWLTKGVGRNPSAPALDASFPFNRRTPIVCIETLSDALYLEENDDVEMYIATFGDIQGSAVSALESANIIHNHIRRLENHR